MIVISGPQDLNKEHEALQDRIKGHAIIYL